MHPKTMWDAPCRAGHVTKSRPFVFLLSTNCNVCYHWLAIVYVHVSRNKMVCFSGYMFILYHPHVMAILHVRHPQAIISHCPFLSSLRFFPEIRSIRINFYYRSLALRTYWLSNARYRQYPTFRCYFFATKYLSGIIPKTNACLLCLLFILILALRLFCFVSTPHQDKVGGIGEIFVRRVTFFIRNIALLTLFLSFVSFQTFYCSFGSWHLSFERMERKGLKRFEGFKGFEPFKVCTLRERISHVLSKNCHVLGNQTLFSEAERGNCFV